MGTALQDELVVLSGIGGLLTFGWCSGFVRATLVVPKMIFPALSLVSTEGHRC